MLCAASALGSVLTGCELSRPEGAFNPVYPEAGAGLDEEFNGGDGDGDGGGDTMPGEPEDPFGGVGVGEVQTESYKDLVGYYLARFDEHTFGSSTSSGVTIRADNLISRFMSIRIYEDKGVLKSQEQLCGQANTHKCSCTSATSSCKCSSTTTIDRKAAEMFASIPKLERDLVLEDGMLTAPVRSTYLGYKASASDHGLPASSSDTRVWDITSAPGGEGVYTSLKMSVDVPVFGRTIECQVSIVQELALTWDAKVKKDGGFVLNGVRGEFDVKGTTSDILDAKAGSAEDAKTCMGDNAEPEKSLEAVVQFLKVDVPRCPKNSEFESMLKPGLSLSGS